MNLVLELEDKKENLIIDCFEKIKAVYYDWKLELDKARADKNKAVIFALEKTFSQENSIRDYIFKYLQDYWYSNFQKEVWRWKGRKDLVYTIYSLWFNFLIEAKRLDWWCNLNNEYIKNWVNRFKNKDWVTNYSDDIKDNWDVAWMLWFVIENWNLMTIIKNIKEKIENNDEKDEVLIWKYVLKKEDSFISINWYFEKNKRIWNDFTLYHYFLDFWNE